MTIRDGDWTLFDYDPRSGRTVWVLEQDGRTTFRTDYPVEATIAENKAVRDVAGKHWKGDYHMIASIPLNVLYDDNTGLLEATKQGDQKHLSRWLNDSDNRAWRTKEGTV